MDENSSYNLKCKYCETDIRFAKFNEFLDHAQSTHGPNIGVSAVAIVPRDLNKPCSRGHCVERQQRIRCSIHGNKKSTSSKCRETASSENVNRGPSTSAACSRAQTPYAARSTVSTTSTVVSLSPVYDLGQMNRSCLIEIINLLSKCLCIWHKPTRMRMSRKERFQGYQLLLRKLQDYEPDAKFRDVRSIVRQLITGFFNKINGEISEDDDTDVSAGISNKDEDERRESNPIMSKSIFEQLMFLTNTEREDLKELDLNKVCSFCAMSFYSPEALFTHMLNNHLPGTTNMTHVTTSLHGAGDASNASNLATNSVRQSNSCTSTRHAFENELDYCTQHSLPEFEHRSASGRLGNRKSKLSTPQLREPRAKKHRRSRSRNSSAGGSTDGGSNVSVDNRRSRNSNTLKNATSDASNTDTDISIGGTSKISRHYLNEYDDKFLEEFIDLYRQQECLWRANSDISRNRKEKCRAYDALAAEYCRGRNLPTVSISKIKKFISRLRRYYDRMCRPNANQFRRHIWQRLAFIDEGRRHRHRRRTKSASNVATTSSSRSRSNMQLDCQQCSRHYKRLHNYSSHMLRMHPPTHCTPCNQHFETAEELKQHLLQQHLKANDCPLCPNAHVSDWQSPKHMAEHFYDHKCPRCTQVFLDGQKFAAHKANCQARFRCGHCNAVFMGTHNFRRHSREVHQEYQPFNCDLCQKRYKFLAPLIRHQRWHERMQRP